MRARNIKPGFFKNEDLAECDPLARILFSGLWCMADREGRLECRPKRIKAELLPYDNCDVVKLMEQLRKYGFIIAYKVDDKIYLSIPSFTEHQNCHVKEIASTIPAPDEHGVSTVLVGPLTDSLLPLTDSPILIPSIRSPRGSRVKKEYSDYFILFWRAYPKRVGKDEAWKAWQKRVNDMPATEEVLKSLEKQKASDQWNKDGGQYVPNPATWINRGSWADELPAGGNGNGAYQRVDKYGKPAPRQKWEDEADRINADYYKRKAAENAPDGKAGTDA